MYKYLGKKALYSSIFAAMLLVTGCSSSDGTSDSTQPVGATSGALDGKVVDGYIANGDVFADINADGVNNAGDIVTVTDALGNIVSPAEEIPFNTYIYVTGGTDLATGRAFTGRMSAYYTGESLVVSPLTTMVAVLTQSGQTEEEAVASVATALGVTVEQVSADPMQDSEVFFAAQRVVAAVEVFSEHTDGAVTVDSFEAAVAALAENEMDFTAAAEALSVPAEAAAQVTVVDTLIQEIEVQVAEAVASGEEPDLESYQTVVAATMDDVTEQIAADPTATVEVPTVDNVQLLYDASACITFDKIKGTNTVETAITADLALSGADSCLQQTDGNVTLAWGVDTLVAIDASGVVQTGVFFPVDVTLTVTITTDNAEAETVDKSFTLTLPRLDNRVPVANNVTASVNEDGEVVIDVDASDEDGDTLSVTISATPSSGVAVVENGQVKYTPAANFNGSDVISYTVTDNWTTPATSAPAMMTVTVNSVDDAPVLEPIANPAAVSEDSGSFTVSLVSNDVDNDPITYAVTSSNEAIATVSELAGVVTVTPMPNASGVVTIDVNATANGQSSLQSFNVTISPINDAPVLDIVASPAAVDEDAAAFTIALSGSDVDGDSIVFSATSLDTAIVNASVSGTTLTLTPVADASGTATVTIAATANAQSVEQNITVVINPVNDAPVITTLLGDLTYVEDFNPSTTILLSADDAEGESVTYSVVSTGAEVNATITGGTELKLAAIADASGDANITVTVDDGTATTEKSFILHITAVNDKPVITALPDVFKTEDDPFFTVELNAMDTENDNIVFTATPATNSLASFSISGTTLTITPLADANGLLTITVQANDGDLTDSTTFDLNVSAVNDIPTATNFLLPITTSSIGNIIDISTHIDDVDGDTLVITAFDAVTGLTQVSDTTFSYDNNGSEADVIFNYTVDDGNGETASATVTLNISTTPVYPVARADSATTDEEVAVNIDVIGNDDAVSVSTAWIPNAENGTVTVEDNYSITVTPAVDFNGEFIVKYTAVSSTGHEDNGTVTVTVVDVNDAPVIQPIGDVSLEEDELETLYVDVNITDVDGVGTLSTVSSSEPAYVDAGTVENLGEGMYRVPFFIMPNYYGSSTITLVAFDGNVSSLESSFTVNISPVADAPQIVQPSNVLLTLDTTSNLWIDMSPVYGENFILEATIDDSSLASVSVTGHEVNVVTDLINTGTTTVNLRVYNEQNSSLESFSSFELSVHDGSNNAPTAGDSEFSVEVDGSVYTQLSVNDIDGNELTFSMGTPPEHGDIVSFNPQDGHATYVATDAYIGEDSFTFTVNDGQEDSNIATVTVHATASERGDDNDDKSSITEAEFNDMTAQPIPTHFMYEVDENGWDGNSELDTTQIQFDGSAVNGLDNYLSPDAESFSFPYVLDGNAALLDFNGDSEAEERLKFVGMVTGASLATDLNMTLPESVVGYKIAALTLIEEYEEYEDSVEYRDWNCTVPNEPCVGTNPYLSLDDYMVDKTYDPSNPGWSNIWIDGYEFKFAQDSNLADGSGVIVRTVRYYDQDLGYEVEVVTNDNAGTWELVHVDDKDRLKITPLVYGVNEVRTYQLVHYGGELLVQQGEYKPAGQADTWYWYDENTMYHIGNSIMNRSVDLPSEDLLNGGENFISFNTLQTAALPIDTSMYGIWAWDDQAGYMIDVDELRFENNNTFSITESEGDGGFSADYTESDGIATLFDPEGNPFVDAKVVEIITSAVELSAYIDIPDTAFAGSVTAYRFTHINFNAEFDAWGEPITNFDGDVSYASYVDFETAFMNGELALAYTNNGGVGFASGTAGVGGTLAEYDGPPNFNVVNANAGTWEVVTVDSEQVMVFNITVERSSDHDAVGLDEGLASKGRYNAAESGNVEFRYGSTTRDEIVTYLQDQNISGNSIRFEIETDINRDLEAVAFTNNKMNRVEFDVNQTTGERSVSREYVWLDGNAASGNFVISDMAESFTYLSNDGEIATVNDGTDDVFMVKVNEELNATQLMSETGLFLPMSAHGYRISYMDLATGLGGTEVKLDDATVTFLESYYYNNDFYEDATSSSTASSIEGFLMTMEAGVSNIIDFNAHYDPAQYGFLSDISFTPLEGLVRVNDAALQYDATLIEGTYHFDYNLTTQYDGIRSGRVTIIVDASSVTPIANGDTASVMTGETVNIDVLSNDTNGDIVVQAYLSNQSDGGVIVEADSTITYIPSDTATSAYISYVVHSSTGNEAIGSISVDITTP